MNGHPHLLFPTTIAHMHLPVHVSTDRNNFAKAKRKYSTSINSMRQSYVITYHRASEQICLNTQSRRVLILETSEGILGKKRGRTSICRTDCIRADNFTVLCVCVFATALYSNILNSLAVYSLTPPQPHHSYNSLFLQPQTWCCNRKTVFKYHNVVINLSNMLLLELLIEWVCLHSRQE